MKKIFLYIDMMYRGGAQRVMNNLATYFTTQGWEVILCNDFLQDNTIPQYEVLPTVKRLYLAKKIEGNAIIKNIHRIIKLRNLIKVEKPDCVLSFLGRPNQRMLIATIGLKTKKIVSVRNDPQREYGKGVRRIIAKTLFRLADGCVFQTEDAKQYFPFCVQRKAAIIFNPVDKRFFQISDLDERQNIVTVGRLEKQKNHALLIDAFCEIAKLFPKQKLILYGDGLLLPKLQERARDKGIDGQVVFAGNMDNIEEYLARAKVFVLSSNYEGMPNALMEAMASGVPCIATDCPCGGSRMLLQNGKAGYLVPCNNKEALAKALSAVLSSTELQYLFSMRARDAAQYFKAEIIYDQWERYIQQVLEC